MVENLVDEKTASSQEANDAPFNRAYDTRLGVWEWFELPENALRHRRFGKAMYGIANFFPAELAVGGSHYFIQYAFRVDADFSGSWLAYDWKSLSKGDLVVDVGGGIGSATLHVAKAFPDLRFIVQGREGTVAAGTKVRDMQWVCLLVLKQDGNCSSSSPNIQRRFLPDKSSSKVYVPNSCDPRSAP
jgi:hypothetical protein